MSASSVRAILSGSKTVTRRVSKRWLRIKAGDHLWVREAWNYYREPTGAEQAKTSEILRQFCAGEVRDIVEAASELPASTGPKRAMYAADFGEWAHDPDSDLHWRSPMFMPSWASRIILEATGDARVERLREITEEDAIAEGVTASLDFTAAMNYAVLWNSLHGKDAPWEANPEVVRIAFRLAGSIASTPQSQTGASIVPKPKEFA